MIKFRSISVNNNLILKDFSLVLASGSRYRGELLARLGMPFSTWAPEIDERPLAREKPADTALRLARAKADAAAARFPKAWIIGSDQVAELDGKPLGKPGTRARARKQLQKMRGRCVQFHTGVCLLGPRARKAQEGLVTTGVLFRAYSEDEAERYLEREPAFDCAGSAKSEALGISLVERLTADDPTALVGLPLIALSEMLREAGFQVP
jgi:septum formation protein